VDSVLTFLIFSERGRDEEKGRGEGAVLMPGTRFIISQQTFYDSGGFQAMASCPFVKVVWTRRKELRSEEVDYAESGAQKNN